MQSTKTIKDENFPIGYNDRYSLQNIPDGYCSVAQNLFLTERNLAQRHGYSVAGTDTNTLLVSKAVLGMGVFSSGATKQLMKAYDNGAGTDTVIGHWDGSGDWVEITSQKFATQSNKVEFEQASGNMYITNGVDTVIKWTGSAASTVAGIPIGKYMAWYHNYLFVANNASAKSRLYFSNLGAPETFGATDYIDIVPDDGYEITGLARFKDDLIIGKQNRLHAFTGWGDTSFTIKSTEDKIGYGVVAGRTMVDCGQYFLYLSLVGDVPHIIALEQTQFDTIIPIGIMSMDILSTMKSINKAAISTSCAFFDGQKAWFFFPTGSSTFNNACVVLDFSLGAFQNGLWTGGWTKHTGIRASVLKQSDVDGEPDVYFGEADATKKSKAYIFDTSNTDDGIAIDFLFESRLLIPSDSNPTKWKYLWVNGDSVGDIDVNIYTNPDQGGYDNQGTINLQSEGSTFPVTFPFLFGESGIKRKRFDLNYGRVRSIQTKFSLSNTGMPVVINDWEYKAYLRPMGQT